MKDDLLTTIIDEHSAVEAFASLLTYEQKALGAASPLAQLAPIVEQKSALADRLALLERARDAQLQALGFPAGRRGMKLAAAADARLSNHWAALQKSVERARRLNADNGRMIGTRMEFNRRALAVLRRVPGKAALYGPDGRIPAFGGL